MSEDNSKKIVERGYDAIASKHLTWVESRPSPRDRYTELLLESLPANSHVLELGCGAGVPVTKRLTEAEAVAEVVANDISTKQLELAQSRCPTAKFVPGDMMALDFEAESFNGVVSFFAIFHLPRKEQKVMLRKIFAWLKVGGYFVASLGSSDDSGKCGDFFGADMFWSTHDVEESKGMLRDVGFELLKTEVLDNGDGVELEETDPDHGVKFLWVLTKKSKG